jgi:hypothetical protein
MTTEEFCYLSDGDLLTNHFDELTDLFLGPIRRL